MKYLFILLAFVSLQLQAQERNFSIGGKLGFNFTTISNFEVGTFRSGIVAGLDGMFKINEKVFFNSGLQIETKGNSVKDLVMHINDSTVVGMDAVNRFTYVTIPAVVRINLSKKSLSPFISLGGYGSYLLKAAVIRTPKDKTYEPIKHYITGVKNFDVGLSAGIGMSIKVDERTRALIEGRYISGFVPIRGHGGEMNQCFTLSFIGYF